MGSLAVQPPNGVTRNLTEVFVFLRNNAQQSHLGMDNQDILDIAEKINLIAIDDESVIYNKNPPIWVNVADEVNYELTRIKSRVTTLREFQQKQLMKLDFIDEKVLQEPGTIAERTEELISMFSHCRRLIRLLEESDELDKLPVFCKLRHNVVASLMQLLNSHMHDFRSSQSDYLRHLDSRRSNLDSFLIKSSYVSSPYNADNNLNVTYQDDEAELTIDQLQYILKNEHFSKEREKEIIKISKSIAEMHNMFKDIAAMIVDQGTILDRIDYNVEQSSTRIKYALKSVKKAEKYQQSKKMQLIVLLAGIAFFFDALNSYDQTLR